MARQDQTTSQNRLTADIFLVHAPSVYDFRERDDVLFAYLSNSDSVNVTSVFEMYPLGFLNIKQYLGAQGHETKIINLASLMLQYPRLDVEGLLKRLDAPVFGLDLHWMAQCHGAIEVANKLKHIHPDASIVFGGISATYFADELIQYPSVDVVVKGYDTLEPLAQLMQSVKNGYPAFQNIPNLVYKDKGGSQILSTGFLHKPAKNYNNATIDWSFYSHTNNTPTTTKLIMTLPNSGCAMDCSWCGGSCFAYKNIMGVKNTLIHKDNTRIVDELRTMGDAARNTSIYALQCYSEPKKRLYQYLDAIAEMEYKSVSFELFNLADMDLLKKMGQATQAYIMLSPESHDLKISKLAGRGNYTMEEMEAWIPKAFEAGIAGIMVWFFIGMPHQSAQSVLDTVAYSKSLMEKFKGQNVIPLLCPMVPFLDPGSRIFENPAKYGYRLFHKTLAQHRQAMIAPLWHQRLNYETQWLSRRQIQDVTYEAISQLVTSKGELGVLPSSFCKRILNTIEETKALLADIEYALQLDNKLPTELRNTIHTYNQKILSYSSDQIIPVERPFGGRWFDDFTVPSEIINELCIN